MYVAVVPNRSSPPAILLRESYREGQKVKNRTLANLTGWSDAKIEALRHVLRGGTVGPRLEDAFDIVRSRPHGHVAATLGSLRKVGVQQLLGTKRSRERDLCEAMIAARILSPKSKLATARGLDAATLGSTLGELLGVGDADEDELYGAMDWLLERQTRIEEKLARKHLSEGALVLYDLTSTYFEGRSCSLARIGYSRDGKKGRPQIEFGLLTDASGRPIAVEVFEGNVGDPKTLASQIKKLRERFGLKHIVIAGDRGMITQARIDEDLTPNAVEWITSLRAPAVRKLVVSGSLQLGLFDDRDMAEISDPAFPGERLVVCRNPFLAAERKRKREELLKATERELAEIVKATQRTKRPFRGEERILLRVSKVINRYKMKKHFRLVISESELRYERDSESIAHEAALDGIYVVRTNVPAERLATAEVVRSYKSLSLVERAFRSLKTLDLHVRPIHHRKEGRVRAHVFLCTLAYYVEWHMREALAPMLFDDENPAAAEQRRPSVVAKARRSLGADRKAATKMNDQGAPVHSFTTLLEDLATIVRNRIQPRESGSSAFDVTTTPTALQQRAFDLLGCSYRM